MGHTVWSQRITLDALMGELQDYGKALRSEERQIFSEMLHQAYRHYGSITYTSSLHAWAFLLLSVLLEQEKRLRAIEHHVAH